MFSAKNLQMVVTVALLIMAAACSLFKEEMHVPQAFELHINHAAAAASQFYVLKNVDTNSEALQKHASSLDSFAISSASYTISDFSGDSNAVISGKLEFALAGSSDFTVLDTFTDLHLSETQESRLENEILLHDSAVRQKLMQLLQRGSLVTFRLNGTASDSPFTASLLVKIDTKMTVEL